MGRKTQKRSKKNQIKTKEQMNKKGRKGKEKIYEK